MKKEKQITSYIATFTDILFGVIIGFILVRFIEIINISPTSKMLKSLALYVFVILYMFDFWLATKIETDILKKHRKISFSIFECFISGIFGIIFVAIGYYAIELVISCCFKDVFLIYVIFDIVIVFTSIVEHKKVRYEEGEIADFYRSKDFVLRPIILFIVMCIIYWIASKGLIVFAISGLYILTLIGEIFIYKLRIRTIYKLR